jgi:hypothetical protein
MLLGLKGVALGLKRTRSPGLNGCGILRPHSMNVQELAWPAARSFIVGRGREAARPTFCAPGSERWGQRTSRLRNHSWLRTAL